MTERLTPYLRYYTTSRPTDDHTVQPTLVVVLKDEIAAMHFRRVAREEMRRHGVRMPLQTAHPDKLRGESHQITNQSFERTRK